jgi:DNA-binding NtrC family response regulator
MITDVVKPQMGGARRAGELASERPDMKVPFVSGYAATTVLRHGAIDVTTRFLQKPFSLKALAARSAKFWMRKSPFLPRPQRFSTRRQVDSGGILLCDLCGILANSSSPPSRIITHRNPE